MREREIFPQPGEVMKNKTPFASSRLILAASLVAWLLASFGTSSIVFAVQEKEPAKASTTEKPADKTTDEKKSTDKKPEKILAITGGDIHTVTQGVIRGGTIIVRDGKIAEIGQNIKVPEGAETIDATGKTVTPGFVAISMSGIGLPGGGGFGGGRGGGGGGGGGSNNELADTLNPFDRNMKLALSVGITSGCVQVGGGGGGGRRGRRDPAEPFVGLDPDATELETMTSPTEQDFGGEQLPTCPCCGLTYLPLEPIDETPEPAPQQQRHVVVKMSYGSIDGMLAAEDVFYDSSVASLMGAQSVYDWRKKFETAKKYVKELAEHEAAIKAGERKQPPRNPVDDQFLKLMKREIPMRVTAESVGQIRAMIALAKEFDYRLVIERATEGWVIPNELSEAAVSVIISPRSQRTPQFGKEDSTGSYIESPRVMAESGVPFAVTVLSSSISLDGIAGRDLTALPLEAAFAIRGGATEAQGLESITINPARMMGMSDRIGSLEVGKDADILILDGSPMDYRTWVETAIVNGHPVYNRTEDRIMPVFERK